MSSQLKATCGWFVFSFSQQLCREIWAEHGFDCESLPRRGAAYYSQKENVNILLLQLKYFASLPQAILVNKLAARWSHAKSNYKHWQDPFHGTNHFSTTQAIDSSNSLSGNVYVQRCNVIQLSTMNMPRRSHPAAIAIRVDIIHNPPSDLVLPEKRPQAVHKENALLRFNAQPLSCVQPIVGFLTVHDAWFFIIVRQLWVGQVLCIGLLTIS